MIGHLLVVPQFLVVFGFAVVVQGVSLPAFQVVCYELLYVLWYVSVMNFVDEFVDVYCVKCFAHV